MKRFGTAYALMVRFTLKSGSESAFDDLAARTIAEVSRNEPNTILYFAHHVEGQPAERIFYELYRDRSAFDFHEMQPYVRTFLVERTPLVDDLMVDVLRPGVAAVHDLS